MTTGSLPPPTGEVPDELRELKEELEADQHRQVPDPITALREHFDGLNKMVFQLATFFQGALEYPNQLEFVRDAVRLANRDLLKEAFGDNGLVAEARRRLFDDSDLQSAQVLENQVEELNLKEYSELDRSLSSAIKIATAYWDWVVRTDEPDPVEAAKQQDPHVEAVGSAERALFIYSRRFTATVQVLQELQVLVLRGRRT
jgi:hypothetical protein